MKISNLFQQVTLLLLVLSLLIPSAVANKSPQIDPKTAIHNVLNHWKPLGRKVTLDNPRHDVTFTEEGISFEPKKSGFEWNWSLEDIRKDVSLNTETAQLVVSRDGKHIDYNRGKFIERYIAKSSTIEQQFIINTPIDSKSSDLIINGLIDCAGDFHTDSKGWVWGSGESSVRLGDVTVFDAEGRILRASMQVTATSTQIRVDGMDLINAAYPVTVDPEIGSDFRISDMGGDDNNTSFEGRDPTVAYSSADDRYLVVWRGSDDTGSLVSNEYEVWGQLIDASNGDEIGNDFRISDAGTDGSTAFTVEAPRVIYNSTHNNFFVAWKGEDSSMSNPAVGTLNDNEFELFGQLLEIDNVGTMTETLDEIGTNDFRITNIGTDGETLPSVLDADMVYNPTLDEYLLVYSADPATGALVNNEFEIFCLRLRGSNGTIVGSERRVSTVNTDGVANRDGLEPAVTYNPDLNEYLVVWVADPAVDEDKEIYGQLLNADGTLRGGEIRISEMGVDGVVLYDASEPAVSYSTGSQRYLVVWYGDDVVNSDFSVYGQFLTNAGLATGVDDFNISGANPDASFPKVFYNSTNSEFAIFWHGSHGDDEGNAIGEQEIYVRRFSAANGSALDDPQRISDAGGASAVPDTTYAAFLPEAAFDSTRERFLAVWYGDDNEGSNVNDAFEIFGQIYHGPVRVSISDVTVTEGEQSFVRFVIRRSHEDILSQFTIRANNGTAVFAEDYRHTPTNLIWTSFTGLEFTVSVLIPDDEIVELDETYTINLEHTIPMNPSPNLDIVDDEGVGRILNDDVATLSIADIETTEDDAGTKTYSFTVNSDKEVDTAFNVNYSTANRTATTADSDYTLASGVIGFVGGADENHTFNVNVLSDTKPEPDEIFDIILSNLQASGRNIVFATPAAQGVVLDDDTDTDNDGQPNITDTDDDNDNVSDLDEATNGTDPLDSDSDDDMLLDGEEAANGTNPLHPDSDLDGVSDSEEVNAGTNPLKSDTDGDGVSDRQELDEGSSPLDPGSTPIQLETTSCLGWNGFLPHLTQIFEHTNVGTAEVSLRTQLFDIDGTERFKFDFTLNPGGQQDLIANDMEGFEQDTFGQLCVTVMSGSPSSLDGRLIFYEFVNANTDYRLAFAQPLLPSQTGNQYLTFNTFQPSLDPVDSANQVANWISVFNNDDTTQSGTLNFYAQDGSEIGSQPTTLAPGARADFSGHQFGPNLVGLVEWIPDDINASFQVQEIRYVFNEGVSLTSLNSAMPFAGTRGSGEEIASIVDTRTSTVVLEVANVSSLPNEVSVVYYNLDGSTVGTATTTLNPKGSIHLIADETLEKTVGTAIVKGDSPTSLIVTKARYGRTESGGIFFASAIAGSEAIGKDLLGSYNTFIGQSCELFVGNTTDAEQNVSIDATSFDGRNILSNSPMTIPAFGVGQLDVCSQESEEAYGVITIKGNESGALISELVRQNPTKEVQLSVPVR